MTAMSDHVENQFLDHFLSTTPSTAPTNVYVGLLINDPTDANTGTEITGGSYVRKLVSFAAASGGSASTNADVSFDQATTGWGVVSHFGIFDALTTGNLLFHGALVASKDIQTGDVFKIQSGNLTLTAD